MAPLGGHYVLANTNGIRKGAEDKTSVRDEDASRPCKGR